MALRKRNPSRPNPDHIENPVPKVAPKKTVIDTVLNAALAAGNGAVTVMAGLLAGVLVLYSGYVLYDTFHTQYEAYSSSWDLLKYKPEYISDGQSPLSANGLEDINQDYRGWLTVYDTSIDYPVVQGPDDNYYAWHNIYNQSALTGAIYLAAMNTPDFSDSYNVVYGHHMDNGAMFGRLDSYRDEGFYNAHRDGIVVTKSGAYDIRFFAVAKTDAYEDRIYQVGNRRDEVIEFLASGGEGGVGVGTELVFYDEAVADSASRVIALSTCASADATSGRLVVFGKMTKRDLVSVDVTGYEGVYDGQPHTLDPKPSEEGTKIEYSTDGGQTWTDEAPSITDVGEIEVIVKVESPVDGTAEEKVVLKVTPKPVTVKANDAFKKYGDPDPRLTATVTGLIGSDTVDYALSRMAGEKPGFSYVITATGERRQGNYEVTYENGVLTIGEPATLTIDVTGYEGEYDGQPHTLDPKPDDDGAKIEYSTDGGKTWTDEAPSITDVGEVEVIVRGENPENGAKTEVTVVMKVTPKPVTVKANDAGKLEGQADPILTATVTGLIGSDTVDYTLSREAGEAVGTYAITAGGDARQGNYIVTYQPGVLTVSEPGTVTINVTGYEGEYDGKPHTLDPRTDDGAKLQYSTDGGQTWTDEAPSITDVGELQVIIRGENPETGARTETTVVMKVTPKPVTVKANDAFKTYGERDPQLTATVTGLIGNDSVQYALSRETGDNVGTYAITASGEANQGNYIVTYVPGTLTIDKAKGLKLTATGYEGKPDGKPHGVTAKVNIDKGTLIEYSSDGGRTWTTVSPTITDAGELKVLVRATNPNYETDTATALVVLTNVETFDLTIRKVWQGDNAANRPASLNMVLTVDGKVRTVRLSAANKWTAKVKGLPIGTKYEWTEPAVSGYTIESQVTEGGIETVVTNARKQQTTTQTVYQTTTVQGGGRTGTRTTANGGTQTQPELVEIEDNGTPLGANNVNLMLKGDCFE